MGSADERYRASLSAHGVRDVQPGYRALLLRLKVQGPDVYQAGVARYKEEVEPLVEAGEADPLRAGLQYGTWLARRWQAGSVVAVDSSGLCEPADEDPPLGSLLIHLPEDQRESGVILAEPATPTEPQQATAALLCR